MYIGSTRPLTTSKRRKSWQTAQPFFHFEYCLTVQDPSGNQIVIPDGHIKSVAIGYLWLYFWHETLIAVRHQKDESIAAFISKTSIQQHKDADNGYTSHTLWNLLDSYSDVREVISKDFAAQNIEWDYLGLVELQQYARDLIRQACTGIDDVCGHETL